MEWVGGPSFQKSNLNKLERNPWMSFIHPSISFEQNTFSKARMVGNTCASMKGSNGGYGMNCFVMNVPIRPISSKSNHKQIIKCKGKSDENKKRKENDGKEESRLGKRIAGTPAAGCALSEARTWISPVPHGTGEKKENPLPAHDYQSKLK